MHYILKNERQMVNKIEKKMRESIQIRTRHNWVLFGAESHPMSKFRENLFFSSYVILLTNQPTNQRMDTG